MIWMIVDHLIKRAYFLETSKTMKGNNMILFIVIYYNVLGIYMLLKLKEKHKI